VADASKDVVLRVGGSAYSGWKSLTVTRSIEQLAGSFELEIYPKWKGAADVWPIFEEDECTVEILGEVVITGYVDKRSVSIKKDSLTFKVSGRDKAGALADCSAVLGKWTYREDTVAYVATKLCEPFKILVIVQPGVTTLLPKRERLTINPGDKAGEALERACKMAGLLAISDGQGKVLLTRAGTEGAATAIEEGVNVLEASAEFDASKRYHKYICLTQNADKIPKKEPDKKNRAGAAARKIKKVAEAFDMVVKRTERVLLINPEEGSDLKTYAQKRVEWECIVRAAKADKVTATVHGWAQSPGGKLWKPNQTAEVKLPTLGANGTMLITEVKYKMGSGGRLTELSLKRPDAFTPEPRLAPKGKGNAWKELRGGV
jgi:prophage tail gpP-like protein